MYHLEISTKQPQWLRPVTNLHVHVHVHFVTFIPVHIIDIHVCTACVYTCILLACCGEGDGGCHGNVRAGQEGGSGEREREDQKHQVITWTHLHYCTSFVLTRHQALC